MRADSVSARGDKVGFGPSKGVVMRRRAGGVFNSARPASLICLLEGAVSEVKQAGVFVQEGLDFANLNYSFAPSSAWCLFRVF